MPDRTILKFDGLPVTVVLSYAKGKAGTNGRGPFHTYTLEGDKVFFASPALDKAIQQQTPAKGTKLVIWRQGEDEWDVRRLTDPPAGQPEPCVSPAAQPAVAGSRSQTNPIAGALRFYTDAVDLVLAVERYAEEQGRELRFTAEDVRAIAATARISAEGRG